jgi:hypothetical protein
LNNLVPARTVTTWSEHMPSLLDDGGRQIELELPEPSRGLLPIGHEHEEEEEDYMVYNGAAHPFAPEANDGVVVPAKGRSNDAQATEPDLTPEEHEAAIRKLLEDDKVEGMDLRTLVFDFGPFSNLEQQLRELCAELVSPEIADAVIAHTRQSIHDVVVTNPQLNKDERSQDGLLSRINALKEIAERLQDADHPGGVLMARLKSHSADGVSRLDEGITNLVRMEVARLTLATQDLAPATLANTVFSAFRKLLPSSTPHLVGDARRTRNADLVKTLGDLKDVATELKTKAGDVTWEKSFGGDSIAEAHQLRDRIQKLTQGVEDQIDSRDLRKGLDDVNELINAASAASVDQEQKSRLKELSDSMAKMMRMLAEALGRLFGKSTSQTPSSPRP